MGRRPAPFDTLASRVRLLMRLVAWLLAAACLIVALIGFTRGGTLAAATLGFPGSSATFFFVVLARATSMNRRQVAELGAWPLYAAGAALSVSAVMGASTLITLINPGLGRAALPLCVIGNPLLAVACLRLSTATDRKMTWYGVAAAAMGLAMAGAVLLMRLAPLYGLS